MRMKRIVCIACIAALLVSIPVLAEAAERRCVDDTIKEVDGDGAILIMASGSIWKVDEVDRVDSGLWLPIEDVLICSQTIPVNGTSVTIYTIINKEENGEEVGAT